MEKNDYNTEEEEEKKESEEERQTETRVGRIIRAQYTGKVSG